MSKPVLNKAVVLEFFMGKNIGVETDLARVTGKLVHYEMSSRDGHKPFTLVLKAGNRFIVCRSWDVIRG